MNLMECLQYLKENEDVSLIQLKDAKQAWDVDILMNQIDKLSEEEKLRSLKDDWYVDEKGIYYKQDKFTWDIRVYKIVRKKTTKTELKFYRSGKTLTAYEEDIDFENRKVIVTDDFGVKYYVKIDITTGSPYSGEVYYKSENELEEAILQKFRNKFHYYSFPCEGNHYKEVVKRARNGEEPILELVSIWDGMEL